MGRSCDDAGEARDRVQSRQLRTAMTRPQRTTRQRGTRITPRSAEKLPSRPKAPVAVTRLVVEDLEIRAGKFLVTIFNSGNLPSFQVRINVYHRPAHVVGQPESDLVLVASATTTLGVLERKQMTLAKFAGGISVFNPHFAVVFDPINDPFPTGRIQDLAFQERNLLSPSLQPSLPGWVQYKSNNLFAFDAAVAVPSAQRTWKLMTIAELGDHVPANPAVTRVFYPHAPAAASSELRQRLEIDNPFFVDEIRRGNVSARTSYQLYSRPQTPRDRGGVWMRFSNVAPSGESVLAVMEPSLTSPQSWKTAQMDVALDRRVTSITVRLVAERRTGQDTNAYFGDVRCVLKHRQVKAG